MLVGSCLVMDSLVCRPQSGGLQCRAVDFRSGHSFTCLGLRGYSRKHALTCLEATVCGFADPSHRFWSCHAFACRATDFGSFHGFTCLEAAVSGHEFGILSCMHLAGGYMLGSYIVGGYITDLGILSCIHLSEGYSLGVFNLEPSILDLDMHSLVWRLQSGGLQTRATDSGSCHAFASLGGHSPEPRTLDLVIQSFVWRP